MSTARGTSQQAIEHHYDVGSAFYELWLDASMTYTCALWVPSPADTLEEAQRRKSEYYLDRVGAVSGTRLLDIGCGFGATLTAAAARGVQAHGLTLSSDQHDWICSEDRPMVTAEVTPWQQFEVDEPYDSAVTLGCIEHVARRDLPDEDRLLAYREFFAFCWNALKPGTALGVQTTVLDGLTICEQGPIADLIWHETFPESSLARPRELFDAFEPWFVVESLHDHPKHYERTCRTWLDRLRASRSRAVDIAGADTVRSFERYLAASQMMFRTGVSGLYRMILRRRDRVRPMEPARYSLRATGLAPEAPVRGTAAVDADRRSPT